MTDEFICDADGESFPTSRGLNIHVARIHGGQKPIPQADKNLAKEKFASILAKSSPSKVVNIFLKRQAIRYNDPQIALSADESATIDGCVQDLMAELDVSAYAGLLPYAPYIAFAALVVPIIVDKAGRIADHGAATPPPDDKAPPPVQEGQRPTLSRKDVQPGE